MGYIEGNELRRAKMLVDEINDLMLSLTNEVNQKRAYTGYMQEKLNGVITDVKCLQSIIEQ